MHVQTESLEERVLLSIDEIVSAGMTFGTPGSYIDTTVDTYTQQTGGTLQIEIGSGTDFDQLHVVETATLDGTLEIKLLDGFVPQEGDTFDFMTFGDAFGTFAIGNGLLGLGDSNFFFEVVQQNDRLQLVVHDLTVLDAVEITPNSTAASDSLGQFFNAEYFGFDTFTINATITVSDFFSVSGSLALQSGSKAMTLADGSTVNTNFYNFGGSDLSAFTGLRGPYLSDTDADGDIDANAEAVGLSMQHVNFGLSLFEQSDVSSSAAMNWTVLTATAGSVEFVGTPDVKVSSTNLKARSAMSAMSLPVPILRRKSSTSRRHRTPSRPGRRRRSRSTPTAISENFAKRRARFRFRSATSSASRAASRLSNIAPRSSWLTARTSRSIC